MPPICIIARTAASRRPRWKPSAAACWKRLAPQPLAAGALEATLAKLDQVKPYERPRRAPSRDGTPGVLRSYLGGDLRDVRWRRWGRACPMCPCSVAAASRRGCCAGVPGADSGTHSHRGPGIHAGAAGRLHRCRPAVMPPATLQVMEAGAAPQPGGRSGRGLHQSGRHHRTAEVRQPDPEDCGALVWLLKPSRVFEEQMRWNWSASAIPASRSRASVWAP